MKNNIEASNKLPTTALHMLSRVNLPRPGSSPGDGSAGGFIRSSQDLPSIAGSTRAGRRHRDANIIPHLVERYTLVRGWKVSGGDGMLSTAQGLRLLQIIGNGQAEGMLAEDAPIQRDQQDLRPRLTDSTCLQSSMPQRPR